MNNYYKLTPIQSNQIPGQIQRNCVIMLQNTSIILIPALAASYINEAELTEHIEICTGAERVEFVGDGACDSTLIFQGDIANLQIVEVAPLCQLQGQVIFQLPQLCKTRNLH